MFDRSSHITIKNKTPYVFLFVESNDENGKYEKSPDCYIKPGDRCEIHLKDNTGAYGSLGWVKYEIYDFFSARKSYLKISYDCPFIRSNNKVTVEHNELFELGTFEWNEKGSPLRATIEIKKNPHFTNDNYLIWFNGTGEEIKSTKHLFDSRPSNQYTIVSGWGTGGAMCGTNKISETIACRSAQISGITIKDEEIVRPYLTSSIDGLCLIDKIKQREAKKLIIGGFSRGAAFFVPYFLKLLINDNTEALNKIKKIMIVLMDPVTGSINSDDKTEKTLRKLEIHSKEEKGRLIEKLKEKGIEVYGLFLFVGFDRRPKHFSTDNSFLDAFDKLNKSNTYITRMGITHSVLSAWSIFDDYKQSVIDTLKIKEPKEPNNYDPNFLEKVKKMLENDLDRVITRELFKILLSDSDLENEESFTQKLDEYTSLTSKLLNEYKYIDYTLNVGDSQSWTDWNFFGTKTTSVEEGKRNVVPDNSSKLKDVLKSWISDS
jgi:hypothetical protein